MKRLSIALVAASVVGLILLLIDSHTTYTPAITATEMQNIYISRIITYSVPILVVQAILLFIIAKKLQPSEAPDRKEP